MTCLSLLELNPQSRAAHRDMRKPHEMHRTMMSMFPQSSNGSARRELQVLWRIEPSEKPMLLLQAKAPPDFGALPDGYASYRSKTIDAHLASLSVGDPVRYRVVLNPVRSSRMHGKNTLSVIPGKDVPDWWESLSIKHGLRLLDAPSLTRQSRKKTKGRGTTPFPVDSFRADGTAEVAETDLLRSALVNGIGRAKSWGCGLLTVARAVS